MVKIMSCRFVRVCHDRCYWQHRLRIRDSGFFWLDIGLVLVFAHLSGTWILLVFSVRYWILVGFSLFRVGIWMLLVFSVGYWIWLMLFQRFGSGFGFHKDNMLSTVCQRKEAD